MRSVGRRIPTALGMSLAYQFNLRVKDIGRASAAARSEKLGQARVGIRDGAVDRARRCRVAMSGPAPAIVSSEFESRNSLLRVSTFSRRSLVLGMFLVGLGRRERAKGARGSVRSDMLDACGREEQRCGMVVDGIFGWGGRDLMQGRCPDGNRS
jgi:hypothetical protein